MRDYPAGEDDPLMTVECEAGHRTDDVPRSTQSLEEIMAEHAGGNGATRSNGKPTKDLTDLERAEQKHIYLDPRTRERVTSVTSVVGALDSGDKIGRGAYAAAQIERSGGNYRAEWDAKRDTGTRVHDYLDYWLNGQPADVAEEDTAHMDAFADWCDVTRPEWLVTERAGVGSVACMAGPCGVCKWTGRLGFGGRFDSIGEWDNTFTLGDFKTGRCYRPELTIQLAGYANFDGLIVYDDKGRAVDLEPMPYVDRWVGIYVRSNGVEVVEVPDPGKVDGDWTLDQMKAEALATFTALLYAKEWTKQINRKGK